MLTHTLGYSRNGSRGELKHACDEFWSGTISSAQLRHFAHTLRQNHWAIQKKAGIDVIPTNDFSLTDHVLDTSLMVGNIPERFRPLLDSEQDPLYITHFAMMRGYTDSVYSIKPLQQASWFNTDYQYFIPEFSRNQRFEFFASKVIEEYLEAKDLGLSAKPMLLSPISYLLSGVEVEDGFHRLDLLDALAPVYIDVIKLLESLGVEWIQFDEPFLATVFDKKTSKAFLSFYEKITRLFPRIKFMIAACYGQLQNSSLVFSIPFAALHVDLVNAPEQLPQLLRDFPDNMLLSMGLIDGGSSAPPNFGLSLEMIATALIVLGNRIMIAPSCSFIHLPDDNYSEVTGAISALDIPEYASYAKQKLGYLTNLLELALLDSEENRFSVRLRRHAN